MEASQQHPQSQAAPSRHFQLLEHLPHAQPPRMCPPSLPGTFSMKGSGTSFAPSCTTSSPATTSISPSARGCPSHGRGRFFISLWLIHLDNRLFIEVKIKSWHLLYLSEPITSLTYKKKRRDLQKVSTLVEADDISPKIKVP